MARKTLTDRKIEMLQPGIKRLNVPDPACAGLYVRVTPAGAKSFCVVTRNPAGKQVWSTLGNCAGMTIDVARKAARVVIERVRAGLPAVDGRAPVAPVVEVETFAMVAETWLRRHVEARKVRTEAEIRRVLSRYIIPAIGNRPFREVRRGDLAKMLDGIEDRHGARQADVALGIVRNMCNWYATRDDDFASPVVRGMKRYAAPPRNRILGDHEIRRIWQATGTGTFGAVVRTLLLTAQRKDKVLTMRWHDLQDGIWHVPHDTREKGTGGDLVLPRMALDVIEAQPMIEGCPYVFSGRTGQPYAGCNRAKSALDRECGVTGWTLHDCRRTGRSLMSRTGVRRDIAERVLGHVTPGVEGIYDRHHYVQEKAHALQRLADLVEVIVTGSSNVVPLKRA